MILLKEGNQKILVFNKYIKAIGQQRDLELIL